MSRQLKQELSPDTGARRTLAEGEITTNMFIALTANDCKQRLFRNRDNPKKLSINNAVFLSVNQFEVWHALLQMDLQARDYSEMSGYHASVASSVDVNRAQAAVALKDFKVLIGSDMTGDIGYMMGYIAWLNDSAISFEKLGEIVYQGQCPPKRFYDTGAAYFVDLANRMNAFCNARESGNNAREA